MQDAHGVGGMFLHFALLSLLAVGGLNSVIPDLQRYMVEANPWLTARQFGEVYALSQATPGPNVMLMTMLGAIVFGWLGAVLMTVALFLPGATITAALLRFEVLSADSKFALAVRRGFTPVVIGLTMSTAWVMLSTLTRDWHGLAITLATVLVLLRTRFNPLWLLGVGAVAGMLGLV
ncbi:MAG: chromate transporter [Burkholderiales bacterium]|nr:chromate transporter [Burkholderiales bacterium]